MADAEAQESPPGPGAGRRGFGRTTFVAGVVVGAFIGACIAMLVAPARGTVVRRRLGRRARELGERAGEGIREGIDDAADRARRDLIRRRRRWKARLERLAENARESFTDPM